MMSAAECVARAVVAKDFAARSFDAPNREHWLEAAASWKYLAAEATAHEALTDRPTPRAPQ